jgi:hypothetical protein
MDSCRLAYHFGTERENIGQDNRMKFGFTTEKYRFFVAKAPQNDNLTLELSS